MSALPETARAWAKEEPAPAFAGPGCSLFSTPATQFPAIEAALMRLRGGGRQDNFRLCVSLACAAFETDRETVLSRNKHAAATQARLALYWLCRQVTPWSLQIIGGLVDRDHTTVMAGIKQAERLRKRCVRYRMLTDAMLADAQAAILRRPLAATDGMARENLENKGVDHAD